MPPLPPNFSEEIVDLISSAERRQKDLAEFQIPRLQSCKGPLSTQQTLAAELREDLDVFGRIVESLDIMVDDQRGEKDRRALRAVVNEFRAAMVRLRQDTRAALLTSKRAIDSQSQSQRVELLAPNGLSEKQPNEKSGGDALMQANDDVTDALRRTIQLMQGELERSVLSSQMLDSSTAALRSTSLQHDTLSSVMTTSKQIITALEKSDWLDRIVILSAFIFFLLVILFILKQRFIDRGLRIALWWTRFVPDFGGDDALLNGDLEKGTMSMESVIASTVTAAASIVSSVTKMADPTKGSMKHTPESLVSSSTISEILASTISAETASVSAPSPEFTPSSAAEVSQLTEPNVAHVEL
ncbi:Sec20-domain-containing protein [Crucibulum laeve]|uniref:Sec20-domain-containing protein n=1 Tax=Crucibulum laeve TaxID=68775 RepID=A0A5C3LQ86_9AGAR|nr:Sec20-domain-containing protein [Crucibulum laeve]